MKDDDTKKGAGGMSRAAKKRAKKRQKHHARNNNNNNNDDDLGLKKKTNERLYDNNHESPAAAEFFPNEEQQHQKKSSKKKRKKETNSMVAVEKNKEKKMKASLPAASLKSSEEDKTMQKETSIIEAAEVEATVSKLTPAQILLLEDNIAQQDNNTDDAPSPSGIAGDQQQQQQEHAIDAAEVVVKDITSVLRARCLLNSLLATHPAGGGGVTATEFYDTYWEKQPLLIQQSKSNNNNKNQHAHAHRLDGFLSLSAIRTLLETSPMCYGRDLNVTKYDDHEGDGIKRRVTLDLLPNKSAATAAAQEEPEFVLANAKDVWSKYNNMGCTIRLLCPQKHIDAIHSLLSTLELEWGCMVGCNAYLTPPSSSQGFAPHYDDIEAFVLQLEGYKHWKVYPPFRKNRGEILPRTSSVDYTEQDLEGIDPVLDVVLGPGDVLYMPRGWIHQAATITTIPRDGGEDDGESQKSNQHSLHLTVSSMQNWSWADLLEILLPEALEAAISSETSTSLREGLPRNFLSYMGVVYDSSEEELPEGLKQLVAKQEHADEASKDDVSGESAGNGSEETSAEAKDMKRLQEQFREEAKKRIMRVCNEAMSMIDAGCDQIGKRFLSDRLPPAFTPTEASFTSENRSENGGKIWPNTLCRLARPGIARLALEDGKAVLYHCADNSRVYHGNPLSPLEFEMDDAPALEMLLTTVEPHWICVQDLIHDDIEDKMELAQSLYDEGILAILQTENPDRNVQVG